MGTRYIQNELKIIDTLVLEVLELRVDTFEYNANISKLCLGP